MYFDGFACDGPECEKRAEPREAHGWLQLSTMVHPERANEPLPPIHGTFCSPECLEEYAAQSPVDVDVAEMLTTRERPSVMVELPPGQYL